MTLHNFIGLHWDDFLLDVVGDLDLDDWAQLVSEPSIIQMQALGDLRTKVIEWRKRIEADEALEEERREQNLAMQHEQWHRSLEDALDIEAEQRMARGEDE